MQMSVNETQFNKLLRTKMWAQGFKFDRIESHSTCPGIPDDAWVHKTTEQAGWLEIKEAETLPAKIKYRPKQALWLVDHWHNGGNCATLIHVKEYHDLFLIPGIESIKAERDLRLLIEQEPGVINLCLDVKIVWELLANAILTLRSK
jgi:hypothetical protein